MAGSGGNPFGLGLHGVYCARAVMKSTTGLGSLGGRWKMAFSFLDDDGDLALTMTVIWPRLVIDVLMSLCFSRTKSRLRRR